MFSCTHTGKFNFVKMAKKERRGSIIALLLDFYMGDTQKENVLS
jgi:hypothetical protein